jgi:hypothetical protein
LNVPSFDGVSRSSKKMPPTPLLSPRENNPITARKFTKTTFHSGPHILYYLNFMMLVNSMTLQSSVVKRYSLSLIPPGGEAHPVPM